MTTDAAREAFRHEAERAGGRRRTGRARNLARAGIVSAASIAAAAVCASASAPPQLVIVTIDAIVRSGNDTYGTIFGTKGGLVGKEARVTFTYDDSKGHKSTAGAPPSYSSIASVGTGAAVSNPSRVTVTIDGHSLTLADLPPGATSADLSSYAERQGAPGSKQGQANFDLMESYNGNTAGDVFADIHFNDPPVVPSYDWESPLSYKLGPGNTSYGSFTFHHFVGSATKDQQATGNLAITSLAVNRQVIGAPPSLLQLAYASDDVYAGEEAPPGYQYLYDNCSPNCSTSGLRVAAYGSNDGKYVIMAVRGTVIDSSQAAAMLKNLLADHSFIEVTECAASSYLKDAVLGAADFVSRNILALEKQGLVPQNIYLTGHSLGAGIAQILSKKSGLNASVFNAPGGACLYPLLGNELVSLQNSGVGGTSKNYRLYGDQVSLSGLSFSDPVTLTNVITNSVLDEFPPVNALRYTLSSHLMKNMITEVAANAQASPQSLGPNVLPIWKTVGNVLTVGQRLTVAVEVGTKPVFQTFDPPPASDYVFAGDTGAPPFGCLLLPEMEGVAAWNIRSKTGSTWSSFSKITGGGQTCFSATGVDAIEFQPLDGSGKNIVLPDALLFATSFTKTGTFNGTLTASGTVAAAASGPAATPSAPALDVSPGVPQPQPR